MIIVLKQSSDKVFGVKLSVIEVFWFLKCYLLFISTMNTKNTLNLPTTFLF